MARRARINWTRYAIVAAAIALVIGAIWTLRPVFISDAPPPTIAETAARIHASVIAIDTHVDIPTSFGTDIYDPGKSNAWPVQVDLPRMRDGGLDAVFFVVYAGQGARDAVGYAAAASEAFAKFAAIRRMTDSAHKDEIGLALSA
ncbi:membrane dipeptidase, partial [Parvibaculum sp.]|uniref:membrane dipeptidase n=1 Tax=Parvibaculum sp. TaxID=2024848 RepID=UPI00349FD788